MKLNFYGAAVTMLVAAMSTSSFAAAKQPLYLSQVLSIAEKDVRGQVTDAELETRRGGKLVYEIEIVHGNSLHELDVDAVTGKIIARRQPLIEGYWERFSNRAERRELASAKAASTLLRTLENRTGGRAMSISFDYEAGRAFYEVELSSEVGITEVYLEPTTGRRVAMVPDD